MDPPKKITAEDLALALSKSAFLSTLRVRSQAWQRPLCPIPENYPSIDHPPYPVQAAPPTISPTKKKITLGPPRDRVTQYFQSLAVINAPIEEEAPGLVQEVQDMCYQDLDEIVNLPPPPVKNVFQPYFARFYDDYMAGIKAHNLKMFTYSKKPNSCDYRRCVLLFTVIHKHCGRWKNLEFDFQKFLFAYTNKLSYFYEYVESHPNNTSNDPSRRENLYDILVDCLSVEQHDNYHQKEKSQNKSF